MMPGMGRWAADAGRSQEGRCERTSIDRRSVEETMEELEKRKGPSLVDPYFNIVQVTVYGQARFYNPPPAEPEAQSSPGDVPATPATPGAPSENAPARRRTRRWSTPPAPRRREGRRAGPPPRRRRPRPAGAAPAESGRAEARGRQSRQPPRPTRPSPTTRGRRPRSSSARPGAEARPRSSGRAA